MADFNTLNAVNVNEHTEKKNGLTYLSWAWAWAEFKKICPTATYEIKKFENGLPYVYDEKTGYMVFTSVTVDDLTHEMWLPVMDSANNAMKHVAYKKKTRYKEVTVEPATMFDINKTIMRCLVKNLAMFGLGLYVYAGDDLPEDESGGKRTVEKPSGNSRADKVKYITDMAIVIESPEALCKKLNVSKIGDIDDDELDKVIQMCEGLL